MKTKQNYFQKVKEYLLDSNYLLKVENTESQMFVIDKQEDGIHNLVLDCEDPILIIEQFLFEIKNPSTQIYKDLLMKNRDIIHGAFVLDGDRVSFRDTLQLENLDRNELEGSLNSLSLLMSEYNNELIEFSK